jgi:hypothetical protein
MYEIWGSFICVVCKLLAVWILIAQLNEEIVLTFIPTVQWCKTLFNL